MGSLEDDLTEHHRMNKRDEEIARLRAELADKNGIIANLDERSAQYERDSVAKDARIAELEGLLAYGTDTDAYRRIRARAERAEARIAELETDHLFAENKRLREACQEFRARAERAETHIKELNNKWADDVLRVERAEEKLKAMREVLEDLVNFAWTAVTADCEEARINLNAKIGKARAALAPSPVLIDDLGQVWPEDAPAGREG